MALCSFVTALLILSFRNDRNYSDRLAAVIKRDECQIRRQYVADLSASQILAPDLYADFHRRMEDPVHARLQDQELANVDRLQEAQVVDCGGHSGPTGVSLSRQSAAQVDQVQYVTAQHISKHVGIIRQCDICVLGAGLPNWAAVQDWSFRLDCSFAHDLLTSCAVDVLGPDPVGRCGSVGMLYDLCRNLVLAQASIGPNQLSELAFHVGCEWQS